jgi:hypothetical protein
MKEVHAYQRANTKSLRYLSTKNSLKFVIKLLHVKCGFYLAQNLFDPEQAHQ